MNEIRRNKIRRQIDAEALQTRFALQVASCLTAQSEEAAHHVDERLRVARERALDRARARRALATPAAVAADPVVLGGGGAASLALGGRPDDASAWWRRLGIVLPLVALLAGLTLIQYEHARQRVAALAEIDTDLLVDDLPLTAYSDPGFVEYLKTAQRK